jgi:hypothetical protein
LLKTLCVLGNSSYWDKFSWSLEIPVSEIPVYIKKKEKLSPVLIGIKTSNKTSVKFFNKLKEIEYNI